MNDDMQAAGENGGPVATDSTPPEAAPAAAPAEAGRLEALENEVRELKESRLRIAADFENFKRRTRREVDDARDEGRTQLLRELLPVFDNLERALQHAEKAPGGGEQGTIEGVRLTLRQLQGALERFEIRPVEAKGKPFDPSLHEAIAQVDSADVEAGVVVEEFQRGYAIGKKLLRPALVSVSKGPGPAQPQGEGGA